MISKTKISARIVKKQNPEIVHTIFAAKKNKNWMKVAQKISGARRKYDSVNLKNIDLKTKEGDTIVVIGKVLGSGEINKKVRVCALGFSESARSKLKKAKCEAVTILEEINKNKNAEGVKILE